MTTPMPPMDLTDEEFDAFHAAITGRDEDEQKVLAGAKAYAADTYRGGRNLAGGQTAWDTLTATDRAACLHKARVVLRGAGALRGESE